MDADMLVQKIAEGRAALAEHDKLILEMMTATFEANRAAIDKLIDNRNGAYDQIMRLTREMEEQLLQRLRESLLR